MVMRTIRINWATIACLIIAYQLIGTLWYSNYMFGELWVIGLGKSVEDITTYGLTTYIGGAVTAYAVNIYLARVFLRENIHNFSNAMIRSLKTWSGFFVPLLLPLFLFSGFGFRSALIFLGYTGACLSISAYALTRWPAKR